MASCGREGSLPGRVPSGGACTWLVPWFAPGSSKSQSFSLCAGPLTENTSLVSVSLCADPLTKNTSLGSSVHA